MKLINSILMVLAATGDTRKTPFERRLIKTFGILGRWGVANLQGHDHYVIKHPEKQNQVCRRVRFPNEMLISVLVKIQVQKTSSVVETERHLFDKLEGTGFKFMMQTHSPLERRNE